MRILMMLALLSVWSLALAQDTQPQQFLYKLTLPERLQTQGGWTEADNKAVAQHFEYLKELHKQGVLILAGRTDESFDRTFGLVIFEAEDEAAARAIMAADPAVKAGVMQVSFHPYRVALLRSEPTPR